MPSTRHVALDRAPRQRQLDRVALGDGPVGGRVPLGAVGARDRCRCRRRGSARRRDRGSRRGPATAPGRAGSSAPGPRPRWIAVDVGEGKQRRRLVPDAPGARRSGCADADRGAVARSSSESRLASAWERTPARSAISSGGDSIRLARRTETCRSRPMSSSSPVQPRGDRLRLLERRHREQRCPQRPRRASSSSSRADASAVTLTETEFKISPATPTPTRRRQRRLDSALHGPELEAAGAAR